MSNRHRAPFGKENYLYKHGMHGTRIYWLWRGIILRCYEPASSSYYLYGARGITVCDRWRDFRNFYADMGERPKGMMLDRTDNSKGYSPDNCKWVTPKESANNRRTNRLITINGETKNLEQWAAYYGIKLKTICHRLYTFRWDEIKAVTTPVLRGRKPDGTFRKPC